MNVEHGQDALVDTIGDLSALLLAISALLSVITPSMIDKLDAAEQGKILKALRLFEKHEHRLR